MSTPGSEPVSSPPCVTPPPDAAAWFKQEVHPHEEQLKNYLKGRFASVRDVEDVVQESYVRIWKAKLAYPIESAKSFLFTIAKRLALDHVRKERASPLVSVEDSGASRVLDNAPNAAQLLLSKENLHLLAQAVAALPSHYRNVIILHKIHGLSQRDTAAKLNLSDRSVEKYCARAMTKCEEFMKERGITQFYFR